MYKSPIPKDSVDKSFKRKHGSGIDDDRLKNDKETRKLVTETVLDKVWQFGGIEGVFECENVWQRNGLRYSSWVDR